MHQLQIPQPLHCLRVSAVDVISDISPRLVGAYPCYMRKPRKCLVKFVVIKYEGFGNCNALSVAHISE
jgi:hypothetical protein